MCTPAQKQKHKLTPSEKEDLYRKTAESPWWLSE
jgi:hypothetical protein